MTALLCLAAAPASQAAIITVNSIADPAGFNAGITIPQLGETVTLRDAVNAANNTAGDDEIVFAPELAGQFITLSQVGVATNQPDTEYSALNITSTVAIRGPVGGLTLVKDGNVFPLRLINVAAHGNLTVEGLTLQGGAERIGGGIKNSGVLTVRSSTIRDCLSQGSLPGFDRGAGIYNSGTLTVTGSSFQNNLASTSGGAIYSASGSLTVSNTVFSNNRGWMSGGAITTLDNGGLSTVSGCTFTGNRVAGLVGNDANDGFGGGAIRNRGVLAVASSTFDGNLSQAGFNGGAICNSGTLNLSGSTFVRNIAYTGLNGASYGGAIENLNQATVANCTFTQNLAYDGTAIDHRGASLALNHCTIVAQQAPTDGGAGVALNGTTTITNSIICRNYWFSTFYNENRPRNVTGGFSGSNNLIDNENPGVGDLGDNGGPTQTMPLVLTSPALDAGIATGGVTTDQRGVARPQGAAVDIGAFEYGIAPPAFASASGTNFFIGTTNQFQVGATGLPAPTFSVSGALPAGVAFTSSGLLSGSPAAGSQGTYPLTFTAVNPSGQVTQAFVLTVIQTDLIVTTALDEDDGSTNPALGTGTSLREAFNSAMQLGGSQTIVFSPALAGQTIQCTIGPNFGDGPTAFRVTTNVTIQGLTGGSGITLARGITTDLRAFHVLGGSTTLTLNDLELANWSSPYGTVVLHQGPARLNRCTVRDNFGDGIIRAAGGIIDATLENCTVVNNGGGYTLMSNGYITLRNSTVTGNTGGALYVSNNGGTVINSIIAGNTRNGSPWDFGVGYATDGRFGRAASVNNLIGTGGSGLLTNGVAGNIVGVVANQLFLGPLADNGGPTQTVALLRNSPAIDRGSAGVVATDQRGIARPQLGGADIGAYEFSPTPSLVVTTPADENDGTSDPAYGTGTSLREALAYAQSSFTNTGFGQGWTLNGPSASVANPFGTLNDTLTITPATQGQANSAWFNQKVGVNSFTASFRYTQGAGTEGADGITFTLQNAGTSALGAAGGALGYGGIGQSVAFAFNIYGGNPSGPGIAVYTNGNVTGTYTPVGNGVSLTNGQPVDITVAGNGTTVTLTMTQGANVFTTTFNNLNIASIVGGNAAYIGFTGATGGAVALQQISRFNLTAALAGTVTFAPALAGQTVTLRDQWSSVNDYESGSALVISGNVTVQGPATGAGVTLQLDPTVERRHFLVGGGASLTLSHLTLTGGKALIAGFGFGGSVWSFGSLTVRGCTFSGNTAGQEGGAIQSWGDSPALLVENSTFAGNTSNGHSSAINAGAVSMTLRHLTITGGSATNGAGTISLWKNQATLTNCIVAGNSDDGLGLFNGGSFSAQSSDNLIGTGTGGSGGLTDGENGNQFDVSLASLMLGSLADNGGPTATIALLPGSPAINAGTVIPGLTIDQRGSARVVGPAPDIGAFESSSLGSLPDWRVLHGLAGDGSQDLASAANDGVANLLKYAFNMAPNAGDLARMNVSVLAPGGTSGLPRIFRDGSGRLVVEFVRRKAATDPGITYQVQTGEDLTNLQPLALTGAVITSIDAIWERVTVTDPLVTAKRFGRVAVTRSP